MNPLSFEDVEQALRDVQAPVSAAEAQGCLCGALCTLSQFSAQAWLAELLPDDDATAALTQVEVLNQLYTSTVAALQSDDLDFAPLMPRDEVRVPLRVAALAAWSQGFLYGFGLGISNDEQRQLPDDIAEVLRDMSEIARADDAAEEESEAVEQAYMELVEYLRAAVQLLYAELQARRDQFSERAQHRH